MRKEAKQNTNITINGIQGYHQRETCAIPYAQQGFNGGFKVFTSDRTAPADGTKKAYGLEIELSSRINDSTVLAEVLDKIVFPLFPAGLFKQQHDGSLSGNSSTEAITQPMTKAFIRNHYNDFKAMFRYLKALETAPNDSCGMHTNISMVCFGTTREKQEAAIMRLHNWLCDNYSLACALFKRSPSHTMYCNNMRRGVLDRCGSHGLMMNYSHMDENASGRVEIRLVGPQKTFPAFRNTLECVFWLVEAAKDGRDFSDIVKLFKGCNECVIDRLADLWTAGLISDSDFEQIRAASVNAGIREATR
jgi:hypothetical protein